MKTKSIPLERFSLEEGFLGGDEDHPIADASSGPFFA